MNETPTAIAPQQEQALAEVTGFDAISIEQLKGQVNLIQRAIREVMVEDIHFGTIPGTRTPTLYKSGAEKLCLIFQLAAEFDIQHVNQAGNHREYSVTCTLRHKHTGLLAGQGIGVCSSMESRYRYRRDGDNRVEHTDPADYYNTCAKMAKKRAHVDAILTATAASDCFTQDLEESGGTSAGGSSGGAKLSDAQRRKIYAETNEKGIPGAAMQTYMREHFGIEKSDELSKKDASTLIDDLVKGRVQEWVADNA